MLAECHLRKQRNAGLTFCFHMTNCLHVFTFGLSFYVSLTYVSVFLCNLRTDRQTDFTDCAQSHRHRHTETRRQTYRQTDTQINRHTDLKLSTVKGTKRAIFINTALATPEILVRCMAFAQNWNKIIHGSYRSSRRKDSKLHCLRRSAVTAMRRQQRNKEWQNAWLWMTDMRACRQAGMQEARPCMNNIDSVKYTTQKSQLPFKDILNYVFWRATF